MSGFVYNPDKPSEVHYWTNDPITGVPVLTPTGYFINSPEALFRFDRMVRAKSFGSIPPQAFEIVSWVSSRITVSSGDIPYDGAYQIARYAPYGTQNEPNWNLMVLDRVGVN